MKVSDIKDGLNLKALAGVTKHSLQKEVNGGYAGDLLSWVMARAGEHNVWVTVIGNLNTIAVAVLRDISCIILTDGSTLDIAATSRANEEQIPVFQTDKSSFETIKELAKLGL